jgi:hypothetical protein
MTADYPVGKTAFYRSRPYPKAPGNARELVKFFLQIYRCCSKLSKFIELGVKKCT